MPLVVQVGTAGTTPWNPAAIWTPAEPWPGHEVIEPTGPLVKGHGRAIVTARTRGESTVR